MGTYIVPSTPQTQWKTGENIDPLLLIPSPAAIRERIEAEQLTVSRLRILLNISEQLEQVEIEKLESIPVQRFASRNTPRQGERS